MGRYDSITRFAEPLEQTGRHGRWIVDAMSVGTADDPVQVPFVSYSAAANAFLEAFYEAEVGDVRYMETLVEYGVELSVEGMCAFDVSDADERLVIALITTAIRIDRFICVGALGEVLDNGSMARWLRRLREVDAG